MSDQGPAYTTINFCIRYGERPKIKKSALPATIEPNRRARYRDPGSGFVRTPLFNGKPWRSGRFLDEKE